MSRIVDFSGGRPREGEQTTLKDLLDKTILIKQWQIFEEGKFGRPFDVIEANDGERDIFFYTSATAILNQLRKLPPLGDNLLRAKIIQRKNDRGITYFALSPPSERL